MNRSKRSSQLRILPGLLAMGLAINVSIQVQAQVPADPLSGKLPDKWEAKFQPPTGTGTPDNREGGASRGCEGSKLVRKEKTLTALVPPKGVGTTGAAYPTLVWYQPQTSAREMELVLMDENEEEIYSSTFAIAPNAEGIMSLQLPASATLLPLEVGKQYNWYVALICPKDRSGDVVVGGAIRRVPQEAATTAIPSNQLTSEKVALYAEAGLWYETVGTLAELRRLNPGDRALADAWEKLLKSVELDKIAQEPVVHRATETFTFSAQSTTNN